MPTIPYRLQSGKRVKGVTTIAGLIGWGRKGLEYWHWNQGYKGIEWQNIFDTATIPGTIAHYLIECFLKKQTPNLDPYEQKHIDAAYIAYNNFLQWWERQKIEIIAVEPNLINEELEYGGTPDLVGLEI